jgi:hypothetical protein
MITDVLDAGTAGDTITNFDADGGSDNQDYIDLDTLFDSLGFTNEQREVDVGYKIVGNELFVDVNQDSTFSLKVATISTVMAATLGDEDVKPGML